MSRTSKKVRNAAPAHSPEAKQLLGTIRATAPSLFQQIADALCQAAVKGNTVAFKAVLDACDASVQQENLEQQADDTPNSDAVVAALTDDDCLVLDETTAESFLDSREPE